MRIGNVEIPGRAFLAPMAGITDESFRLICRSFGAAMAYSEMISAKSIVYGNANTKKLLDNEVRGAENIPENVPQAGLLPQAENRPLNHPFAVQLFGHEPDVMAEAIKRLAFVPFDLVDINMGCPVPKVVRNGEGSALMNDPVLAGKMVEAAAKASGRPVTVKIRKGFTAGRINCVEIAKAAEAGGASAVAVHGRTRDQFYAGVADWEAIAAVKRAVTIPVIGSGDIFTHGQIAARLAESGCDAVMVARGALGNPWIFSGLYEGLPDVAERARMALIHLDMAAAHKGAFVGLREMRKHLSWYVKGWENATGLRVKINGAGTVEEVRRFLLEYLQ